MDELIDILFGCGLVGPKNQVLDKGNGSIYRDILRHVGWRGSRVVSMLDSGEEGPAIKSQS